MAERQASASRVKDVMPLTAIDASWTVQRVRGAQTSTYDLIEAGRLRCILEFIAREYEDARELSTSMISAMTVSRSFRQVHRRKHRS